MHTVQLAMVAFVFLDRRNLPHRIIEAGQGILRDWIVDITAWRPNGRLQPISDLAQNHSNEPSVQKVRSASGLLVVFMRERKVELFKICLFSHMWQCFFELQSLWQFNFVLGISRRYISLVYLVECVYPI